MVGALVTANVAAFGYELWLAGGLTDAGTTLSEFIARWGLVPREFLREVGSPGTTAQIVWLTPFTAMFLHAGVLHLMGNMLYLWVFGAPIEDLLGHLRFAGFYLACGLAAAAIQLASDPMGYRPTVGASGAIAGVLGAYLVSYPRRRLRLLWPAVRIPAYWFLLPWIVIQVLSGVFYWTAEEGGTAWWAHVGGFVAGIALVGSMRLRSASRSRLRI